MFGENELIVFGMNAADGVTAGEDVVNVFYDGILPPGGVGPAPGDLLINLNAGLLTDSDADVLVKRTPTPRLCGAPGDGHLQSRGRGQCVLGQGW